MGRRVIAVAAALIVALLGVVAVVVYAQAADGRAVAGQATQTVFFAKAEVPMGTSAADAVNQQLIAPEKVVSKGVPQGALTAVTADIAKLVATSSILPGEIILTSRFGALPSAVTQVVPAGKIAITVTLSDPQRIAPLLTPQSHIVIFDTVGVKSGTAATSLAGDQDPASRRRGDRGGQPNRSAGTGGSRRCTATGRQRGPRDGCSVSDRRTTVGPRGSDRQPPVWRSARY